MDLSIIIPVYNAASTLRSLVQQLLLVLNGTGMRYEIIFVEDGSHDNSWEILSDLQKIWPDQIVAIQLMRNYGQHNALMCGFRNSHGEYVVTMDDDLQNPPEEIPKLLEAIETQELDLVYGCYEETKEHCLWRNLGSWMVNVFYRIVFKSSTRVTSFRIVRRELLESIFSYSLNFTYIDGLLAWNTQRIGEVIVKHHPRSVGRSGYSLGKLITLAFNLFTNFSLLPLQLVSSCGLFVAIIGLLMGVYYLIQYLFSNIVVPGYASTIVAILILGGTQLLALGIMGEYLGRLHLNVNCKPQYVERHILRHLEQAPQVPVENGDNSVS
jgi:glycosyltransferase involved in cell wall biosynthesis